MATYKGKDGIVKAGGSLVGECKSWEITETANEVDSSRMGDDWTRVQSTQLSWKGSMALFWDPADAGQINLAAGSYVTLEFYPRGNTVSYQLWTGQAMITSISRPQAYDGLVEAAVEFTGNGTLTKTVV